MKKVLLVLFLISALLFTSSCAPMAVKAPGSQSSISGMNDITRLKITADTVGVRTGCSNTTPVLQTVNKDTRLDVLSKVAEWYAVRLPSNDIGFVPQTQCTPVIPNVIKPGTPPNYSPSGTTAPSGLAPGTNPAAPGTNPAAPGANPTAPGTTPANSSALTADEQQMLNLVNQARAQAGVPALQVDMELTKVARIKSQDMIDENYFSHNSPKYGSPFDMMRSFGINFVAAGENIAGNQSVQAAQTALMNSPGHRKNILSTDYTHIGVGIRSGGQFGMMFTQEFISKPT